MLVEDHQIFFSERITTSIRDIVKECRRMRDRKDTKNSGVDFIGIMSMRGDSVHILSTIYIILH